MTIFHPKNIILCLVWNKTFLYTFSLCPVDWLIAIFWTSWAWTLLHSLPSRLLKLSKGFSFHRSGRLTDHFAHRISLSIRSHFSLCWQITIISCVYITWACKYYYVCGYVCIYVCVSKHWEHKLSRFTTMHANFPLYCRIYKLSSFVAHPPTTTKANINIVEENGSIFRCVGAPVIYLYIPWTGFAHKQTHTHRPLGQHTVTVILF